MRRVKSIKQSGVTVAYEVQDMADAKVQPRYTNTDDQIQQLAATSRDEWLVDRISAARGSGTMSQKKYLVHWSGFEDEEATSERADRAQSEERREMLAERSSVALPDRRERRVPGGGADLDWHPVPQPPNHLGGRAQGLPEPPLCPRSGVAATTAGVAEEMGVEEGMKM
ncbi:hypothetical protein J8273_1543 [Carpediemonas membranifera]|uniref:Chromo domain-containing protein n=1 Tax=Carpediemonas membranifera TaxID=201153 RepID=A0A8J6AXF8_9EUKA|nr:hypothetical protein J8273_1543 [Carpediemonas membranifera]|eukprot:KAG9396538.1 hypothetical protein J8273_1543 [Carpediemonas membranifera]